MKNINLTDNKKGFDFTAIRIFFSVIAILLSLTLKSAQAVTEKSEINKPSILEKIIVNFKNQNSDSILRTDQNAGSCRAPSSVESRGFYSNKDGLSLFCPLNKVSDSPNES